MEHNVTMSGLFNVTKGPRSGDWKASVSVDWDKVPVALWADLLAHGLKQKVADAASGAKDKTEAEAAMFKALDAIYTGEWTSRGSGEGLNDIKSVATLRLFKAAMDKDTVKRFNKLSASDQVRNCLLYTSDAADE